MERMTIRVIEVTGNTARVEAVSCRRVGDQPEAIIQLEVRAKEALTKRAARDIALAYLDPA